MRVWDRLDRMLEREGGAALVSIVSVRGSSPREVGARMIVGPSGGFHGTIGGGTLEWKAIAEAQAMLARGAECVRVSRFALGPDLGQCCGGDVRVLLETFAAGRREEVAGLAAREAAGAFTTHARLGADAARLERRVVPSSNVAPGLGEDGRLVERFGEAGRPVYLFGAGHVGRALVLALAPLPFTVTWIDPRPAGFPDAVPANVRPVLAADPAAELASAPDGALVLVMTHSHALDLDIVRAALAARRFAHVGVIGSATKRARFVHRLRAAGFDAAMAEAFQCPIGIGGIGAKLPAAIAASVAADLLVRDEALRRAAAPTQEARMLQVSRTA